MCREVINGVEMLASALVRENEETVTLGTAPPGPSTPEILLPPLKLSKGTSSISNEDEILSVEADTFSELTPRTWSPLSTDGFCTTLIVGARMDTAPEPNPITSTP